MADEGLGALLAQSVLQADDPIVPIPPEVFNHPDHQGLEMMVDEFIRANKLPPGAGFMIPYPGGPKRFEYLGPDSGGRKDWMEKGPPAPALTS